MFQSTVRRFSGYGVPGELAFDGPCRVQTLPINSNSAANNIFGRAFRNLAASGGPASADIAAAGSVFAGILCNPKEHPLYGDATGTLAPSLAIPNGHVAGFLQMGIIILATQDIQAAAPLIGDQLQYEIATGKIVTVAAGTNPATGFANVPNGTVYHLPQAVTGAGQLFVAKLTN